MDTDLQLVVATLADVSDAETHALIAATNGALQTVPSPLASIDGTCDWELDRRRRFACPLQPPEAAIDPSEDEVSINAAIVLRDQFAQDSREVPALLDALVDLLTGSEQKH